MGIKSLSAPTGGTSQMTGGFVRDIQLRTSNQMCCLENHVLIAWQWKKTHTLSNIHLEIS